MTIPINLADFKRFEPVPVVARSTLRRGQASLYDLIISKVETGDKITLEEARNIWLTKVCRNMIDGKPHRTTYLPYRDEKGDATGGWYPKDIPMIEEEILFVVLNWLMKNIGLLVIRGYLKVVPMVQLEAA